MDKNRFSQFEERVQALVEGGFARLFAGRLKPREVALRLARAMEDNADVDDMGLLVAPNRYVVHLHPDDHAALLAAQPELPVTLAGHLVTLAAESDLRLDVPPEVVLSPDNTVALHGIAVRAEHVDMAHRTTKLLNLPGDDSTAMIEQDQRAAPELPNAFLVVHGDRYVPLERTVVNVGRRRDNSVVIDDRRVSRQHCQLRYRLGQFVLYDLGSRGGTFVNGERVTEVALRSGDAISLAGVPVVYVVDDTTATGSERGGDTQVVRSDDAGGPDHA